MSPFDAIKRVKFSQFPVRKFISPHIQHSHHFAVFLPAEIKNLDITRTGNIPAQKLPFSDSLKRTGSDCQGCYSARVVGGGGGGYV